MGQILEEQGYVRTLKIRAECLKFHCKKDAVWCCCQGCYTINQILLQWCHCLRLHAKLKASMPFSFPNSTVSWISLNSAGDTQSGFTINAPYHPKRPILSVMCLHPLSQFLWNVFTGVHLLVQFLWVNVNVFCHKFSIRSLRFVDGYWSGLNGQQVALASKQYCGHHVLPESTISNLTTTGINWCICVLSS